MAAVGNVKKIDMLPLYVGMGLCQGMMPLVAFKYASGDYKRMRETTTCARIAGMGFALLCVLFFEIFSVDIVRIFIDDSHTVELGSAFLKIACLATPLMVANIQYSYTFQAMGRGKESLILSACRQGLVNIPLLFIMNYFFQVQGVLWTQIIADIITFVVSFVMFRHFNKQLHNKAAKVAIPE
jgi:Na+-driven multidrug efflux pump